MRGQVRDLHPRQYQKPCVVCDKPNVAPPRFRTPTDVAVAAAEMTWRRTPCQTRDRPTVTPYDIFQMLAHRLLIAQIVMVLDEAVEHRLFRRPSYLPQLDGPDLTQLPRK